jgi:catechol 2,3-dioxygenase-like lactoylglutathione lyase family enzyme
MNEKSDHPDVILHTVIVQTSRMEKMADFYRRGLGLKEPAATGGDHLGFPLPNAYFGFDQVPKTPAASGVISLWFEVENINEIFSRFQELGAEVKYPPSEKPWGAVLAALYDPEGNVFGLTQRGTNPE